MGIACRGTSFSFRLLVAVKNLTRGGRLGVGGRRAVFPCLVGAAVLLAATVVAWIVASSTRQGASAPNIPSTVVSSGKIVPEAQLAELKQILGGFRRPWLPRIELGPTPYGWGRGGVWISFKVKAPNAVELGRAQWYALIAAGLLRDVSRKERWPQVRGYSFTLVEPSGKEKLDEMSVIGSAFGGKVVTSSERSLRTILARSAAAAGFKLVEVRFVSPLGHVSPEITVETNDPQGVLRAGTQRIWPIVGPVNRAQGGPRAEGTYVLVQDENGEWVTAAGYAVRAASGVGVSNPTFR